MNSVTTPNVCSNAAASRATTAVARSQSATWLRNRQMSTYVALTGATRVETIHFGIKHPAWRPREYGV